jgi:starvation-inducible DNA-binding protein
MISIGIDQQQRQKVADELKKILANEFVLYVKTLKMHWNVQGKHFGALHKLFQDHYELLLDIVDTVAERIRQLDYMAPATMEEYLKLATIKEEPGDNPDDMGMIQALLAAQEAVIRQVRPVADFATQQNDTATNNLLAELLEKHEKMAWMLRAHLS